jgi:rhamnulokinase
VALPDGLHWDIQRLWDGIKAGIAASASGFHLDSIGIDSWGVDFALLGADGELLETPFHYRDSRTEGMLEEAFRRMPRGEIFELTGNQFIRINTLYQLLATVIRSPSVIDDAERLLMVPDLFNHWLTGRTVCEFTNATTTQCFDPRTRDWAYPLLDAMGIPARIFGPVVPPGTVLGNLAPRVARELDLEPVTVVAPACHDTGSAAAAVHAESPGFAWLSSGTWSIMGTDLPLPVVTPQALEYNFTNEGGAFGDWRVSKNTMGLWLVQECRREWARKGDPLTFEQVMNAAAAAKPFLAVVDPDHPTFLEPGDMPARISGFCRATGQAVPGSIGEIARVALESIALKYRLVLERLEELVGRRLEPLHIVGGGARNGLLNQLTADCTGHTCVAGPFEATATGNILLQAVALGRLGSLAEAREVVRGSFHLKTYQPRTGGGWNEAFEALTGLVECTKPRTG